MDICHKVSGYIESAERASTDGVEQDLTSSPARPEHPPHADKNILLVAGDMINEEPGNSGNVVQECSMPHGLNTSVTLRRIAANLATSATGDNWINDVLSYDNRPLGSNNATLSLPERLEFVLGSQVGSNVKLPALNLLIQIYSTEHLMSDNNKTRLPAKPLAVGRLLLDRASIVDSASDMDLSIVYLTKDVLVSRGECTSWAAAMNLLYSAHIHSVIKYLRQRIARMGKRHNTYVIMRLKLGGLHLLWHEVLRASNHLQGAIECLSHAWVLIPDEADSRTKTLSNLGSSHLFRFERRSELENISKAINCQIRAVHLMPKGHPDMPSQSNNLGISYRVRCERLGEQEHISKAAECQTQIVHLTPKGHPHLPGQISNLGNSYRVRFDRLGELEDISKAIDCQTQAVHFTPKRCPHLPDYISNLGNSYRARFERLGELEDISKAIECQAQAVCLTSNGHPHMPGQFNNLGVSYRVRFERLGELEDISKAIECQAQAVRLTPKGHPHLPGQISNLGNSYRARFERLGELEDISKAIDCQMKAVHLTPKEHPDMPSRFSNLGNSYSRRFERLGELDDIIKANNCQIQAVRLTSDEHAHKPDRLLNFGNNLRFRFSRLRDGGDIASAIGAFTQALSLLPQTHALIPTLQLALGHSHLARGALFRDTKDMAEALQCFVASASSATGSPSIRFQAAKDWTTLLHKTASSSILPAHRAAMRLLPEVIWLGTTSARRYECVTQVGAVPVEAAAAAISAKEYDLALEWLEQGRSILWTQTLQLRMPYDNLSSVDPILSQQLQRVSAELELASQRTPGDIVTGSNPATLEQATLRHQHLTHQYEKLVAQARELPGFHNFMLPKKAAELMLAAQSGPVVVVNVYAEHCDALILTPQSHEVAHLPLPELSNSELGQLHNLMLTTLKAKNIRERTMARLKELHEDHFRHILTSLWHKLVKPVLDFLGYISKPSGDQLPHITWCTTGALSFLPIHAAGDYDSGGDRIFDLAVTSYTPTLSALLPSTIQAVESGSGVLAVGQESTPGLSNLPGTRRELAHIKEQLEGPPYMQLEDSRATPQIVLDAMEKYECVHLACHGSQHADNPTQSCFYLHGGTLTLEQIAQRALKHKRLAFLSACQTAKGDQEFPDEAIHLAAGMLIAGYPSVIATMWSISDSDAPLVANQVYRQLLLRGVLDYSQVGRAVHAAVGALREDVGETVFSRWVPYIHIGK